MSYYNRTDSTGASSPITNALGSVLALTNSSGNITTQYGYDPFGNTTGYSEGQAPMYRSTQGAKTMETDYTFIAPDTIARSSGGSSVRIR